LPASMHPKRCGHMPGKEVIPLAEGVKKIEAACLARCDDAFAIIARTDALAIEGLDGTCGVRAPTRRPAPT
jgi:2-methylisocitrate lyase-like PEP mutase family enzyme